MENLNNIIHKRELPELTIPIEELMAYIDTIKWEEGHESMFNGITIHLIVTPRDSLEQAEKEGTLSGYGKPAEFHRSESGTWDIYLHDTIPEQERKRVLFHELVEINMIADGLSQSDAHKVALREELKIFGKRTVDFSI